MKSHRAVELGRGSVSPSTVFRPLRSRGPLVRMPLPPAGPSPQCRRHPGPVRRALGPGSPEADDRGGRRRRPGVVRGAPFQAAKGRARDLHGRCGMDHGTTGPRDNGTTRMGRGNGIRGIREIRGYILDGAPVSVLRLRSRCAEEIRSSNIEIRNKPVGNNRGPRKTRGNKEVSSVHRPLVPGSGWLRT